MCRKFSFSLGFDFGGFNFPATQKKRDKAGGVQEHGHLYHISRQSIQ